MRTAAFAALAIALALGTSAARGDRSRTGRAVVVAHQPRGDVPSIGPRHAPVTIELFITFAGNRQEMKAYQAVRELIDRHPRRVRALFYIVGDNKEVSHAALEAFALGKFEAFMHESIGSFQRPSSSRIPRYAADIGIPAGVLKRAGETRKHIEAIRANEALFYRRSRGDSRRRMFINGAPITATLESVQALEEYYDEHYAAARTLMDRGVAVEDVFEASLARQDADWLETNRREEQFLPGNVDGETPPVRPPQLIRAKFDTSGHPSRGAQDAPVVIAFACNFQSRHCKMLFMALERLLGRYPDDLRIVFMPLFDDAAHPSARLAHEAALCARDQGLFWEYAHRIFSRHRPDELGEAQLLEYARSLQVGDDGESADIDIDGFTTCVTDRAHREDVEAGVEYALAHGVMHVPSLVVGRRIYVGARAQPDRELGWLIERERFPGVLARARYLRVQLLERVTRGIDNLFPPPADAPALPELD